ncbi:MAG: SPOR domain-containing protein [Prevotellaceae bacterium]|jgi:cell division protein FtsN|nr:SPOR domain-containing protein [Prevotellaceae bacterium]
MKKLVMAGLGLCITFSFFSCKSSESAYKKAYEKAKQQELAEPQTTTPVATAPAAAPVTAPATAPTTPAAPRVVESASVATEAVRKEKVEVVSGSDTLKDFSIVCGSFGVKANAESLQAFLVGQGYRDAVIAFNPESAMYRVIVATYADRYSAAKARDEFKARYANRQDFQASWLLHRIK